MCRTFLMNSSCRSALLAVVDLLLGFLMIAVLPFAWILKDGIGPDSVPTTGFAALGRVLMTFYVGPAILILVSTHLLLKKGTSPGRPKSRKESVITWVAVILAVSALSLILVWIIFRP